MPDFDIDNLKKTWQEQVVSPRYDSADILEMLNKKSRNYVKYIFWISAAEFLFFFGIMLYYVFKGDDSQSFINILQRLGINTTKVIESELNHIYIAMKVVSLLVTGLFVVKFYISYKKINVESNLKKFILQIIGFKKTVNAFILTNILLLIGFTAMLTLFIVRTLKQQNIHLDNPTFIGFVAGVVVGTLICVGLIWVYYKLLYGIIMGRLSRNLEQLQEIDHAVDE